MLYIIGLGLDKSGISLHGKKILKSAAVKKIYLEEYTVDYPYSKKELEKETLTIPVCIFSHDKLSGLESITKYLKEEKGLSYHEIAVMLGRDDRTIWHACHQATLKMPELLPSKGRKDIAIPVRIFKERKVSVLEHIASYLKQTHGLTYHEIAALLHRDDRTIWTVISRAQKKGVRYG